MRFKLVFLLLPLHLFALPGYFEPWGKDADVKYTKEMPVKEESLSPLSWAMKQAITFHQKVISPADGPRSHFRLSSSGYMWEAIKKHGFFKGYAMGCDRLLRENDEPWVYRTELVDGKVWKVDLP